MIQTMAIYTAPQRIRLRSKHHLRRRKFLRLSYVPLDGECCAGYGALYATVDEKAAYMAWASRGDWWKDVNAFGLVAPVGKKPQEGEVGGAG
jgi:hypothetical protein